MASINHDENDAIQSKNLLMNSINTISNNQKISLAVTQSAETKDNDDHSKIFSMKKIFKNLLVLSLALVLLFTAYTNMLTLQSSLNTKQNVGVNSLIIHVHTINSKRRRCPYDYSSDFSSPFMVPVLSGGI